jgi:hypothetical protein
MKPFDLWWTEVLNALDSPREIGNWTAREGYGRGGKFIARTYRSLPREIQVQVASSPSAPDDLIICSPLEGARHKGVGRKSFEGRYQNWRAYKDNRTTRQDFGDPSPYLISLFKCFEHLMDG